MNATKHDDVIKWKHFPRYWPFVRGIHRSPVNSPHRGQWRRALMFSLIHIWINGWVNNLEVGDLRRYRAHHDVIVMAWQLQIKLKKVYTTDTMIHIFLYKKTAGHYYNVSVIVCDSLGGSLKMNSYISIIIITWLCRFLVWNCSCAQLQLPSSSRRVCCPRKCYKACKCYKGICATNTVSYNSYGRV